MNTAKPFLLVFITALSFNTVSAQLSNPVGYTVPAPSYAFRVDPAPDPALRHNRLLQEKTGEGVLLQVGNYKVKGSPYLFGGKTKGDMFSATEKGFNIYLSYNTYNQNVEFFSTSNPGQALVKEPGDLDSFNIHADQNLGITSTTKFIYGPHLGSKEKAYYQEIYAGPRYSVYKKYKSELGYVSENYIQSELRQFDLLVDYFYLDADKKLKKIKPNSSVVIKEFKDVKDLSTLLDPDIFTNNAEQAFRKTFEYLNN